MRARRRFDPEPDKIVDVPDPKPTAEQTMICWEGQHERCQVLWDLLDSIDPSRRDIFQDHEFLGLTTNEIAHIYGLPESTVKTRLRLAWKDFNSAATRHRAKQRKAGARMPLVAASDGLAVSDGLR
jgi:DNA-directed RNA polymerase specialized sigma24 family protein